MPNSQQTFIKYFPKAAAAYTFSLWEKHQFQFRITKPRNTKFGDFRVDQFRKISISVNGDLPKSFFLFTYLHEVAHLLTYKKYGRGVAPHGIEWKKYFIQLMQPVLNIECFNADTLPYIRKFMMNPKATMASTSILFRCLHPDATQVNGIQLKDIPEGGEFTFRGSLFQKIKTNRTRSICLNLSTKKRYLIQDAAIIEIA